MSHKNLAAKLPQSALKTINGLSADCKTFPVLQLM
jgi:hypothetical protein